MQTPAFDVDGDRDCNCLGYSSHPQQYFLSQHKSLELRRKPTDAHLPHPHDGATLKNSNKKSLRKAIRGSYESPHTARTIEPLQEYYSQKKITLPKNEEETKMRTAENRRSVNAGRADRIEGRSPLQIDPLISRKVILPLQGWQGVAQPVFRPPPLSPRTFVPPQPPQPPIRINFSHSPPAQQLPRYSPLPSPRLEREEPRRPQLSDLKEELRINIAPAPQSPREHPETRRQTAQEFVEFELTEDNLDTPRQMPVDRKRLQGEDQPRPRPDYLAFGDTLRSHLEKPRSNKKDPHRSRIETGRSRVETGRSRIDGRGDLGKSKVRSLREEKKSLRKMEDVEEIRSMVDSEEGSQDKESVVLGRLHEYGSMLDPSLSLTTPTLRSKLVSMNTQSSTIAKSFLRPFELSIERMHFK